MEFLIVLKIFFLCFVVSVSSIQGGRREYVDEASCIEDSESTFISGYENKYSFKELCSSESTDFTCKKENDETIITRHTNCIKDDEDTCKDCSGPSQEFVKYECYAVDPNGTSSGTYFHYWCQSDSAALVGVIIAILVPCCCVCCCCVIVILCISLICVTVYSHYKRKRKYLTRHGGEVTMNQNVVPVVQPPIQQPMQPMGFGMKQNMPVGDIMQPRMGKVETVVVVNPPVVQQAYVQQNSATSYGDLNPSFNPELNPHL